MAESKDGGGDEPEVLPAHVEPEGYEPPQSAEELLERYAAGERYFVEAQLHHARLRAAVLHEANLGSADLSHADLYTADLHLADLDQALLASTNLDGAVLLGASLAQSNLTGANLADANLRAAVLSGALLYEANLSRADIRNASLDGEMGWTSLASIDLTTAATLSATHLQRSEVGTNTLHLTAASLGKDASKQGEVEGFLRGCGLEEGDIAYFRSLIGKPIEFYSCFISYSHKDKPFARRVHDQLQARGIRCWLDEHQMHPGDDIYAHVDRGIRLWDKVILCCSEASLNSWWVGRELDTAFEREMQLNKNRGDTVLKVIPLNLDGHLFDWAGSHASALRKRLAPDFTGWESDNAKFEAQFELVVKAMRADTGGREAPPEPKL